MLETLGTGAEVPARHVFEAPGALTGVWRNLALEFVFGPKSDHVLEQVLTEPLSLALGPLMPAGDPPQPPSKASTRPHALVTQWPLALQPSPNDATANVAFLAPPVRLMEYALKHRHMPAWRLMAEAGLRCELYRLLCSPGFDLLRLKTDHETNLSYLPTAYSDPCTVDEALALLDGFGLVLFGQGAHALEAMQLVMHFQQHPPIEADLPGTCHPEPDSFNDQAQALVSEFDRRFFSAAQSRFGSTRTDHIVRAQYADYRDGYPARLGLKLAPRQGKSWPLQSWIGPGWHAAEPASPNRWFRWSTGTEDTAMHIPLACAGQYQIRAYVHPNGTPDIMATLGAAGQSIVDMFMTDHGDLRVLEGQIQWREAGWCCLQFRHGTLPQREGPDLRQRGFVLGWVLIRRLS